MAIYGIPIRTPQGPLCLLVVLLSLAPASLAQPKSPGASDAGGAETGIQTAAVTLDGETLFRLRGISAFPAEKRAAAVAARIQALAEDASFSPEMLRIVEEPGYLTIRARNMVVVTLTDADAEVEGVQAASLARLSMKRIAEAIQEYRQARTPEALLRGGIHALGWTLGFLAALFVFLRIYRRVESWAERFCRTRVEKTPIRALGTVEADRLWTTVRNGLRIVRVLLLLAGVLAYLNIVLGLLPWTRPMSKRVFELVLGPLHTLGLSFVQSLPNLAFLVVLFFVIRFVLKLTRMFFEAAGQGTISFSGFDPEWAAPTYRIARVAIVAFGLIVAYPYLPGSGSEAFKGVSLFIGVIFSLGSSGAIANIIAGYSLTYRRAYKMGDRVRIGDVTGDVEKIRLQVTHLRSLKNEEIIIPNSVILNSSVVNYSSMAKQSGLILHTTVGIGYETPWRQVEAMLLEAARRTEGLMREPAPFILEKELGDFAVTYELNVYCDEPQQQLGRYAGLHRNILDVFNEYGVQIMTPAYEGDPSEPKVVPKDKWFEKPASTPGGGDTPGAGV